MNNVLKRIRGQPAVGHLTMPHATTRLVWDLPVRITHWLLVACVGGSWATHYAGVEWFQWHRRLGYAVLVLVAFRVAWGFVGTRHARFANFLRGPRAIVEYLRSDRETVGHNPLGALGVVAMLGLLGLQAATGLFANDEIMNAGPFYGWISPATEQSADQPAPRQFGLAAGTGRAARARSRLVRVRAPPRAGAGHGHRRKGRASGAGRGGDRWLPAAARSWQSSRCSAARSRSW